MAVSPRLIRRRIRSVQNTKKITKAMELVAAAKMRRAVAAALKTRAYANLAWRMIESLEGTTEEDSHPLLRSPKKESPYKISGRGENMVMGDQGVLYVVMASDRGLCGGFNTALFRELAKDIGERRGGVPFSPAGDHPPSHNASDGHGVGSPPRPVFVAIGKKAEQFIRRMNWQLTASFTNIAVAPTVAELRPIAKIAMDAFISGEVDEVRLAFTDFVSSLRQQPRVKQLLPLQRIEEIGIGNSQLSSPKADPPRAETLNSQPASTEHVATDGQHGGITEFVFEPSPAAVLASMLPRLTELQVYQCYLETGASEHSARMLAMRNASDAATEMVDDLTLNLNQARQSLITREIAEISAGRAALIVE